MVAEDSAHCKAGLMSGTASCKLATYVSVQYVWVQSQVAGEPRLSWMTLFSTKIVWYAQVYNLLWPDPVEWLFPKLWCSV